MTAGPVRGAAFLAAFLLTTSCGGGSTPTEPLAATPTPVPTPSPTPSVTASLSGAVTERGVGTGIAGAQVVFRDVVRLTGPDGAFSITDLPPGPSPIVVTKEGWLPGGQIVDLAPGANAVTVTLERVAPEGACTFLKDGLAGCLPTTKASCDALGGSWLAGTTCTAPPPPAP